MRRIGYRGGLPAMRQHPGRQFRVHGRPPPFGALVGTNALPVCGCAAATGALVPITTFSPGSRPETICAETRFITPTFTSRSTALPSAPTTATSAMPLANWDRGSMPDARSLPARANAGANFGRHRTQRGERNQHRVLRARGDEKHLRRHLRHQGLVRVRHVEQGVVEHDVVHQGRRGHDLAELSVVAPVIATQRREVDIHPDAQLRHVRFRDLGLHRHRREVRDAHDDGRLLIGVQRLPLFCRLRDDGPRDRRVDLGVAEVRLVPVQRRLRLLHLRLDRVHLGKRRFLRRFGDLQRVGGGRFLAHEVLAGG